jgi:Asp-tRNA(Asn)/Glu-tRNA(Gln) amidotransferase A subunit family amidase
VRHRRPLAALILVPLVLSCSRKPAPAPIDVVEATIPTVEAALRSGRTTCRMVVEAYLGRIRAYDDSTGLHAITVINPRALQRADSLDTRLARGDSLGALFCVPMLVKDNYDTHDLPTTGGSIALLHNIPPTDATVVRRIRQAGAVVVAKTNMAEWAFSAKQTVSSSFDTTANAYALDRVPAGSSGGTASGVAASFGLVGLGTDTGNSIRGPSSHLDLFGIRSTIGLVSRAGVIPLAFDRDVAGPMARTVADAARVLSVIAGPDPDDPYTTASRGHVATDYTKFLERDGLRGARIGVLRALADPAKSDTSVLRLFDQAVADLRAGGAVIVDSIVIPHLEEHLKDDDFCPRFRYDMHEYLASLGPEAPIHDVMEVLKTGQYSSYVKQDLEYFAKYPADVPPSKWEPPCPDYADNPGRQSFLRDVVAAMDSARVEAIVYPTWTYPPAHLDRAAAEYRGDNSQLIAPPTGMPAGTVPMGFSYGKYPAGLQILARPWDEGTILRLAYAYEQATDHRRPPPGFPALPPGR